MVYGLLLSRDGHNVIVRGTLPKTLHARFCQPLEQIRVILEKRKNFKDSKIHGIALLRTCHQLSHESSSVLYSMNKFCMQDTRTLKTFLNTIGPNRSMLRKVEIGPIYRWSTRPPSVTHGCVQLLCDASNLREFQINVCRFQTKDLQMKEVATMMQTLIKSLASRGFPTARILEIIHLSHNRDFHRWGIMPPDHETESCEDCKTGSSRFQEAQRAFESEILHVLEEGTQSLRRPVTKHPRGASTR